MIEIHIMVEETRVPIQTRQRALPPQWAKAKAFKMAQLGFDILQENTTFLVLWRSSQIWLHLSMQYNQCVHITILLLRA